MLGWTPTMRSALLCFPSLKALIASLLSLLISNGLKWKQVNRRAGWTKLLTISTAGTLPWSSDSLLQGPTCNEERKSGSSYVLAYLGDFGKRSSIRLSRKYIDKALTFSCCPLVVWSYCLKERLPYPFPLDLLQARSTWQRHACSLQISNSAVPFNLFVCLFTYCPSPLWMVVWWRRSG